MTPVAAAVPAGESDRGGALAGRLDEAAFTADRCKGHLDGHRMRIRAAYEARLGALGLEPDPVILG